MEELKACLLGTCIKKKNLTVNIKSGLIKEEIIIITTNSKEKGRTK